jgi:ribonuclease P protein subunit RPR2
MQQRQQSGKPEWQKKTALERIKKLFEQAEKEFGKHPERSNRYVQMARKIAMRYNIQIPKTLKRRFCKSCYSYLVPGTNCTVRTNTKQHAVIITCFECKNVSRHPYRKEKLLVKGRSR